MSAVQRFSRGQVHEEGMRETKVRTKCEEKGSQTEGPEHEEKTAKVSVQWKIIQIETAYADQDARVLS